MSNDRLVIASGTRLMPEATEIHLKIKSEPPNKQIKIHQKPHRRVGILSRCSANPIPRQ